MRCRILPIFSGIAKAEEVVPPVLSLFQSVKVLQQLNQMLLGEINRKRHVLMPHMIWDPRIETWWQKENIPPPISVFSSLRFQLFFSRFITDC